MTTVVLAASAASCDRGADAKTGTIRRSSATRTPPAGRSRSATARPARCATASVTSACPGLGRGADPLGDVDRHGRLARIDAHACSAFALTSEFEQRRRRAYGVRGRVEGGDHTVGRQQFAAVRLRSSSSPPGPASAATSTVRIVLMPRIIARARNSAVVRPQGDANGDRSSRAVTTHRTQGGRQ